MTSEPKQHDPGSSASSPDDARPEQQTTAAGRNRWSVSHVGIAAGVISAIAALITAIVSVPWISGNGGTSSGTSPTTEEPAALSRLLLDDPLTTESSLPVFRSSACSGQYQEDHLVIEVHTRFTFCGTDTAGFGNASTLAAARVEADYRFTTLPPESYRTYGAGSVQLRCRGTGSPAVATGIYAWLTPTGWWGIDHFRNGKATNLVERRAPDEPTQPGEVRRFRLDCLELGGGAVEVTLYVDDHKLGSTLVAEPPPPGDVGVAVNAFTANPTAVAFSKLRVYGPEL